MKTQEYIDAVKAKLDEVSPFGEPGSFIAAGGDTDYDKVKPIIAYIEEELPHACEYCLNNLPVSLLAKDVTLDAYDVTIDREGVGHVEGIENYYRLTRVSVPVWQRDVTAFITSADPAYLLQQKFWTRGGIAKPVVAWVPEKSELELYSFPNSGCAPHHHSHVEAEVYYINPKKTAGEYDPTKKGDKRSNYVHSPISDYIVLRCAACVLEILGQDPTVFLTEYNNKLNDILK